jgi:hypothetical protein
MIDRQDDAIAHQQPGDDEHAAREAAPPAERRAGQRQQRHRNARVIGFALRQAQFARNEAADMLETERRADGAGHGQREEKRSQDMETGGGRLAHGELRLMRARFS